MVLSPRGVIKIYYRYCELKSCAPTTTSIIPSLFPIWEFGNTCACEKALAHSRLARMKQAQGSVSCFVRANLRCANAFSQAHTCTHHRKPTLAHPSPSCKRAEGTPSSLCLWLSDYGRWVSFVIHFSLVLNDARAQFGTEPLKVVVSNPCV